jgi:hypothetical protein
MAFLKNHPGAVVSFQNGDGNWCPSRMAKKAGHPSRIARHQFKPL